MPKSITSQPVEPTAEACKKAHTILCYAHDSAASLLDAFSVVRKARKAHGTATDEEQDLLRAMLVFASAGLDSMVKQLIRDALPAVVALHEGALAQLGAFARRRLRGTDGAADVAFLAGLVTSTSPRDGLIAALVDELTGNSLQSAEEVLRAAVHFGMDPTKLPVGPPRMKVIFGTRNRIIHEMDVDFAHPTRNRTIQRRDDMVAMVNDVLALARALLLHVDATLSSPAPSEPPA